MRFISESEPGGRKFVGLLPFTMFCLRGSSPSRGVVSPLLPPEIPLQK
jgi:hypothetical protein